MGLLRVIAVSSGFKQGLQLERRIGKRSAAVIEKHLGITTVGGQDKLKGQIVRIGQELLRFEFIGQPEPSPDGTELMGSPNPGYWGKLTVIIGRDVLRHFTVMRNQAVEFGLAAVMAFIVFYLSIDRAVAALLLGA